MKRTWAEIDRAALHYNFQVAQSRAPGRKVIAVVKADAYGHGAEEVVASLLNTADGFAVASADEALLLRQRFSKPLILCLSGLYQATQLRLFQQQCITPVIFHEDHLKWLKATEYKAPVWLKFNSGMNRVGLCCENVKNIVEQVSNITGFKPVVMTHFASADDLGSQQTQQQIECFDGQFMDLGVEKSASNSAAILNWPSAHYDYIRPGIMLYGGSAQAGKTGAQLGLKPVMCLKSRLINIHEVVAGGSVGYSAAWTASKAMRIGIVACGYADGYPRQIAGASRNGSETVPAVAIGGQRAAIVGRVSMDSLAIDLTAFERVQLGDEVELWGEHIAVDEVASWASTISYQLFCQTTARATRVYIN